MKSERVFRESTADEQLRLAAARAEVASDAGQIVELARVERRRDELRSLTTDELRQRLTIALRTTAEGLMEMAMCVQEIESRGDDLSAFRLAILPYLRRIAAGTLLPELVVAYAGTPDLLAATSVLPLADQRTLLETGAVSVAVVESDGSIGSRRIDPRALPKRDISIVFRPDGIVPPVDQVRRLSGRMRRGADRHYNVRVDRTNQMILVGRSKVPIADVLTALSRAAGWGGEIDVDLKDCPTAAAKLLPEEKERLRALAKATGLAEWELVRRAILAWLI